MITVPMEGLMDKVDSIYKLVNMASRRTLEIAEGAPPLSESASGRPFTIALQEIYDGKIEYRRTREKK